MTIYKVVKVTWEDSATFTGWNDDFENLTPSTCMSIGILIKDTKRGVAVTHSLSDRSIRFCDTIVIPRKCISEIKTIHTFKRGENA